jgi:hypothetical protein
MQYKNDKKSISFREEGNKHFLKKEFIEALLNYNKSICYAESKKEMSLGYGNRSAVYLEVGYYDECLKNIEWARENGYPASKMIKLNEREEKCKNLMANAVKPEDLSNFFKLSYPANEKIPWIANCLEMKTTEKYGRGIYATKDLNSGDVISVEDAYMAFFDQIGIYKHCSNCYKSYMMNLIPCTRTGNYV